MIAQHNSVALSGERLIVRAFLEARPKQVELSFRLGNKSVRRGSSSTLTKGAVLHRSLAAVLSANAPTPAQGLKWALDYHIVSPFTV